MTKIFGGQRQLKRTKVASSTMASTVSETPNPYLMLDFLQSRMNAYESALVGNVEEYMIWN